MTPAVITVLKRDCYVNEYQEDYVNTTAVYFDP